MRRNLCNTCNHSHGTSQNLNRGRSGRLRTGRSQPNIRRVRRFLVGTSYNQTRQLARRSNVYLPSAIFNRITMQEGPWLVSFTIHGTRPTTRFVHIGRSLKLRGFIIKSITCVNRFTPMNTPIFWGQSQHSFDVFTRIVLVVFCMHPVYIYYYYFFTKWPPALILDLRNSLSIAFLAISDRYATWFFLEILTKWLPSAILDVRNSLPIVFLAILDQYGIFIFFGNFWQTGCRRPFWMSEIHFRSHFCPF